jgi:hypothetical protein
MNKIFLLFGCYMCCSMYWSCVCLLPPGDNPITVNKYIISYHIISYHIISYHIISYHIIYYIIYHIIYYIISYINTTGMAHLKIYIIIILDTIILIFAYSLMTSVLKKMLTSTVTVVFLKLSWRNIHALFKVKSWLPRHISPKRRLQSVTQHAVLNQKTALHIFPYHHKYYLYSSATPFRDIWFK